MEKGKVPIEYGLFTFDPKYEERVKTHFPNSNREAYGGCVVGNERETTVHFCPLCREAETEWLKHPTPQAPIKLSAPPKNRVIHLKPPIIVKELAMRMSIKPFQLISDLMQMERILVPINHVIEPDIARKLCKRYGIKLELKHRAAHAVKAPETLKLKPPSLRKETLAQIERSIANLKAGKVSGPIDVKAALIS